MTSLICVLPHADLNLSDLIWENEVNGESDTNSRHEKYRRTALF